MDSLRAGVLYVLVPLIGFVAYRHWKSTRLPVGLTLPPGPPPLPIFGSVLDLNRSETPWLTYMSWAKQYGPLMYVRLLGRDVIVISSEELLHELVEKRSKVYSDRPRYVTNEFFGIGFNSGFLPYGDDWRLHRRMLQQTFRSKALQEKLPILLRKRESLVKAIMKSPDDCLCHLKAHSSSVIMATVYGYETKPENDRLLYVVERMLDFSLRAMTAEREALASTFPFIKYIPTWVPGSYYRRDGLQCQAYCKEMVQAPFEYTVNAMASGDAPHSMVSDLLTRYEGREDFDAVLEHIKGCTATVFGASATTTDTTFMNMILSLVLNPDVQRRAQAEIDAVVPMDRLPDFNDRPTLPYVEAVLRESWRWHPTNPLSIPHATTQPDVYEGYYIPKGAIVLINAWAMSRAEKYHDPESFIPERFLTESGDLTEDEVSYTFGAGLRKCAGKHFAVANVWVTLVTLLSCFEFSKVDEDWGIEDVQWTNAIAVAPLPFPFKIKTRDRAKNLFASETA